ncbi:cupin domain-containing protein [soil metagenome]
MPLIETLKQTLERATGMGRPTPRELRDLVKPRKAWPSFFADDGLVPNNPVLPFIHYRGAAVLAEGFDPAAIFERLFESNGWGGAWRNGVYDYVHYHPCIHEVLGIARGTATVQFGGTSGKRVALKAGDVVILPAGTGHQAMSASGNLLVVGAYPATGTYDLYRASKEAHDRALNLIPKVPLPRKDPVYGRDGPLKALWRP